MKFAVIIPGAGAASRYQAAGAVRHKLDEDLGGKPVLHRTVELFTKFEPREGVISTIIVAGPAGDEEFAGFKSRHADRLGILGAVLVRGGAVHRWETVRAALAHVPGDCTHVAVHDAARPCASAGLLDRVFDAATRFPAVIPAIPVPDTIKRVAETDETLGGDQAVAAILGESAASKQRLRAVTATVDRAGLVLAQTPQVFERDLLAEAYAQGNLSATDDAGVVEALLASNPRERGGRPVRVMVVEGEARNLKITVPADLALARHVLGVKEAEGRPVHKRF